MSIRHHPSQETLEALCNGSLDQARSVVVAAHVENCALCRQRMRLFDHLGGMLLDRLTPTPMSAGAVDRALALLDPVQEERVPSQHVHDLPSMPEALRPYELGPWRWIGPGTHWRSTNIISPDGYRVFLLRARGGVRLPHHTHTGIETTLILKGAYVHEGGRFGVGDLEEADGTVDHQPVVEDGEECICLVAMNGDLRLLGLVGRLMQPFVRL